MFSRQRKPGNPEAQIVQDDFAKKHCLKGSDQDEQSRAEIWAEKLVD